MNRALETFGSIDFRPDDPGFIRDPFPLYARLRDHDPVHWSPRLHAWILTRYDDCRRVLLAKDISSDRLRPFFASMPSVESERIGQIIRYLSHWMVFRDPPEHTRLRRLIAKAFNLKSMSAMRPAIERTIERLLDTIGPRPEIDFVADFAGPLPALVIMAMLGVPPEELGRIKRLSDDIALFIGSSRMASEKYAVAESATREMASLFRDLIAARRVDPRNDLVSELIDATESEDRLTEDELVATCILLLFAGH